MFSPIPIEANVLAHTISLNIQDLSQGYTYLLDKNMLHSLMKKINYQLVQQVQLNSSMSKP